MPPLRSAKREGPNVDTDAICEKVVGRVNEVVEEQVRGFLERLLMSWDAPDESSVAREFSEMEGEVIRGVREALHMVPLRYSLRALYELDLKAELYEQAKFHTSSSPRGSTMCRVGRHKSCDDDDCGCWCHAEA